jgi:hypothetical protein
MSLTFDRTTIPGYSTSDPRDEVPDFPEYGVEQCERCHAEPKLPYGGRGPRPKLGANCKAASGGNNGSSPKVKGKNAALAAQATTALMTLNGFMALGLVIAQLPSTSAKFREEFTRESFEDTVYNALLLDPELCAFICRGGVKSGKIALIIGYALAGAAVAPTLMVELREKKADRMAAEEEAEQEARQTLNAEQVWQTR